MLFGDSHPFGVGPADRLTDQQLEDGIVGQILGAANELELKLTQGRQYLSSN
ncbi:hypothetical protein [Halobellus marinus]|uniref:hypothetical protein n=1 Tax=Halobellus TaxID=1073986 RepID=UPI0028ACF7D5|nr:hypothetical protein [Halobellus sp. DFY28]